MVLWARTGLCDLHSFSGFPTYGRNVTTSLLGPSAAGLGQRDSNDVAPPHSGAEELGILNIAGAAARESLGRDKLLTRVWDLLRNVLPC